MLDPHSGSEYGAARIAAMIAATITIILTGLVSFGFMVPYAQADSFGTLTINAVWGQTRLRPNHLPAILMPSCASPLSQRTMMVAFPHNKTVSDFSGSLPIGNA